MTIEEVMEAARNQGWTCYVEDTDSEPDTVHALKEGGTGIWHERVFSQLPSGRWNITRITNITEYIVEDPSVYDALAEQ